MTSCGDCYGNPVVNLIKALHRYTKEQGGLRPPFLFWSARRDRNRIISTAILRLGGEIRFEANLESRGHGSVGKPFSGVRGPLDFSLTEIHRRNSKSLH